MKIKTRCSWIALVSGINTRFSRFSVQIEIYVNSGKLITFKWPWPGGCKKRTRSENSGWLSGSISLRLRDTLSLKMSNTPKKDTSKSERDKTERTADYNIIDYYYYYVEHNNFVLLFHTKYCARDIWAFASRPVGWPDGCWWTGEIVGPTEISPIYDDCRVVIIQVVGQKRMVSDACLSNQAWVVFSKVARDALYADAWRLLGMFLEQSVPFKDCKH